MERHCDLRRWIVTAIAAAGTLCAAAGAEAREGPAPGATAADPRYEMIKALEAPGPHPSLGDQAKVFDRLVGTWDSEYDTYAADGSVSYGSGEVRFGWIIDGRAMQDIWIGYPRRGAGTERFIGTSLRFYDSKAAVWRVVWVAPTAGSVTTLEGGVIGDRIVLRGRGSDGSSLRWSFNDIRPETLVWRGEVSRDGGKTWRVNQEQRMRRRSNKPASL